MATFQFDTAGINPNFGGGTPSLPPGKHPVKIVDSEFKPDKNGNTMLTLEMEAVGGPAQGGKQRLNLNVSSPSETAKRIAYEQLAAICSVVGIPAFTDTRALHDKPFIIEVTPQKGEEAKTKGWVEVSTVFDINGGKPGQAAAPQANVSPAFQSQPVAAPAPSFAQPQQAAPAFASPPAFNPPAAPSFGTAPAFQAPQQPAAFGGGAPTGGFAPPPAAPGKMPWEK